jgi:NTE family protein
VNVITVNEPTDSSTTAFVFAGGGSLGAVQVGMLKTLVARGVHADFVVGASVGAINAAYFATDPTAGGIARLEAIWRNLRRADVFPFSTLSGIAALVTARGHLVAPGALSRLLHEHFGEARLETSTLRCVIVATDLLEGIEVRITTGPITQGLLASAAIPGVFPSVLVADRHLMDGSVANHSPVAAAVELGAKRLFVLPTGYSCARAEPPHRATGRALQALNILVAGKLANAVDRFGTVAEIRIVPPLCPLETSPFDFSRAGELIDRAAAQTEDWLEHGVELHEGVPHQLLPHTHRDARDPYGARTL